MGAEVEQMLVKIGADIADLKRKTEEAKSLLGSFGDKALELGKIMGIAFGAEKVVEFFKSTIDAASESEQAISKLTNALKAQGVTSTIVRDGMLAYSASLQKTTTYHHDAITAVQTLLFQLGRLSGDGLQRATKDTLDLASGLGIDLESAARLVGKAAAGSTAAFARYGLVVHDTGDKAKNFQQVLSQIEQRFGGAAAAQVDTYAGSMKQFQNEVKEVEEAIGKGLLPVMTTALKTWADWAAKIAEALHPEKEHKSNLEELQHTVNNLSEALDYSTGEWGQMTEENKKAAAATLNMTLAQFEAEKGTKAFNDRLERLITVYQNTTAEAKKTAAAKEKLASTPTKVVDEDALKKQLKLLDDVSKAFESIEKEKQKAFEEKTNKQDSETGKQTDKSFFEIQAKSSTDLKTKLADLKQEYADLYAEIEAMETGSAVFDQAKFDRLMALKTLIPQVTEEERQHELVQKQAMQTMQEWTAISGAVENAMVGMADHTMTSAQAMKSVLHDVTVQLVKMAVAKIIANAGVAGTEVAAHDASVTGYYAIAEGLAAAAVMAGLATAIPGFEKGGVVGGKGGVDQNVVKVSRGEEILTESDPRHVNNGGMRGSGGHTFNFGFLYPSSGTDLRRWVRDIFLPEMNKVRALG